MTTRQVLSTAQVAEQLDKSIKTVQRMAEAGEIPGAQKLSGRTGPWIFDAEIFKVWLAGQQVTS